MEEYALFSIDRESRDKEIAKVSNTELFQNKASCRMAHLPHLPDHSSTAVFTDVKFKVNVDFQNKEEFGENLKLRRIY